MTKEQKYDVLVSALSRMHDSAKQQMRENKEPDWPKKIDDYKEVVWFRNGIHDAVYAQAFFGTMNHIMNFVIPNLEHLTTTEEFGKEEG